MTDIINIPDRSALGRLQAHRADVVREARELAERAASFNRDLSSGEKAKFDELVKEANDLETRIRHAKAGEDSARALDSAMAELDGRPVTGRRRAEERSFEAEFREVARENSRRPIEVFADRPRSYYQPGVERRDLFKTAPANFQPVSFYDQIIEAMVETSAVLDAGATLLTTTTGEELRVPRSTALSSASIVAEAGPIPESDPTLGVVTLGAYKYAILIQVSREMIDDTTVDLQGYLARETGVALGNALGNHLINGSGTGQPRGVLADATVGVTGPTGTATSLGAQGSAGQGTDLLNSLVGSLAEPYTRSPAAGFLLRTSTLTAVRNLKATTGQLVGNAYISAAPAPFHVDPFVPAMAANAKSILFGDWSRYFVRIVNGIRFERSDDFAFNTDMVTFRAIMRADGALIDVSSVKYFANSAS